ncbi:retrovirus-related pol polyprotein from transposon TNT 1-94 [Tanacetum coccineum]
MLESKWNGQIGVQNIGNGNVVAARAGVMRLSGNNGNQNKGVTTAEEWVSCKNPQLQAEEVLNLMASCYADLDEKRKSSKQQFWMANMQQARHRKKLKSDFKIREDELLDKQIQLENKIKELDNILVKTGQSIQTMHMLSPKPDSFYHTEQKMALGYQNPFYLKQAQQKQQSLYNGKVLLEKHDPPVVHDSEETLQLAQESRQKMKQLNKEIKPANYTKINHLSGIFVSQTAKSQEEKLENENVELEFQVRNYEKEIAHLKTTYKNLFDSISVTRAQTKSIIDSLQNKLQDTIYENAKLRAQLFDKVSEQVDTTKGVDNTAKTRRPYPRSNQRMIGPPLRLKLDTRNDQLKFICVMCKQCLITANHDVCNLNYVNDMNSRGKKQKENVSNTENQKKQKPKVKKPKKVGLSNLFMVRRLGLLQAYDRESKASHQFRTWKFWEPVALENEHVAVNFWFGDLHWVLDSYLELLSEEILFVRNLDGVDLLKGNRFNQTLTPSILHEMASASPICLMAQATSTKSWLWHQRLSHLNFDTINDLAKNDLVTGLPKFKYHKEHICPSCEQGKSKKASHPPKPVPNSKQRLHLLHMDLCGPMRIMQSKKRNDKFWFDCGRKLSLHWVHFPQIKQTKD